MNNHEAIRLNAEHIKRVGTLLVQIANELSLRAVKHDASKWSKEEWPYFEESTTSLSKLTYGSDEYKQQLEKLKPALEHHYSNNSHHPEFYKNGINEMNLFDLVEMIADWKAATERHEDGDINKSLLNNKARFSISDQLYQILINTVQECKNLKIF